MQATLQHMAMDKLIMVSNYYFILIIILIRGTFISSSGSSGAQILNLANQGAAYINYTAHGWEDGWADPAFDNGMQTI